MIVIAVGVLFINVFCLFAIIVKASLIMNAIQLPFHDDKCTYEVWFRTRVIERYEATTVSGAFEIETKLNALPIRPRIYYEIVSPWRDLNAESLRITHTG